MGRGWGKGEGEGGRGRGKGEGEGGGGGGRGRGKGEGVLLRSTLIGMYIDQNLAAIIWEDLSDATLHYIIAIYMQLLRKQTTSPVMNLSKQGHVRHVLAVGLESF